MEGERKRLTGQLEALTRICGKCTKNPVSGARNRVTWCNENCDDIAPKIREIGKQLEDLAKAERKDRERRIMALPEYDKRKINFLETKKRPPQPRQTSWRYRMRRS